MAWEMWMSAKNNPTCVQQRSAFEAHIPDALKLLQQPRFHLILRVALKGKSDSAIIVLAEGWFGDLETSNCRRKSQRVVRCKMCEWSNFCMFLREPFKSHLVPAMQTLHCGF